MSTPTQQLAPDSTQAAPATLTPEGILALGLGFWNSKTLLSAVELGVFTVLADGPLIGENLASRLDLNPRSWRDFFDALVALGMLARDDDLYRNTPETTLFLDGSKPSYIGGMLEMANARLYPFWGSLTEALRTGRPQNEAKRGGDFFGQLYRDPDRLKQFLHAMTGLSTAAHKAIAAKFPWDRHRTFVDVGCAEGGLPVELALARPHLTGIGFDLPACAPHFDYYVHSFGLERRLRFQPGDFFADPLPEADVLILGHILHDWDLAEKQTLLAKAHAALPEGGAVLVFDAIIDNDRSANAFGLLMSLNMLIETPAGFDYTGADCQEWLRQAGFRDTYVDQLAGPDSMVVGIK
jgi:SAM-dependent methyltransferase